MSFDPSKNELFIQIPLKIYQYKYLKNRHIAIYGYLMMIMKISGKLKFQIGMAKISTDLNIPRQKVSKLITDLKNWEFIKVRRTGKKSVYEFLPYPVVTHAVTTDVTHAVTTDVTHAVTSHYNRDSFKDSSKDRNEASPDFLKTKNQKMDLWRTIPIEYRKCLRRSQVVYWSVEKIEYCIERMNHAINNSGNPVKAFMDASTGKHAKYTRKMEEAAVAEQQEHQEDLDKLAAEQQKQDFDGDNQKRLKYVPVFRKALAPIYDRHSDEAIMDTTAFNTSFKNHMNGVSL